MKANEAPEKLYLSKTIYSTYLYQVPDPDDKTAVEYIRKDAFIEKACGWLSLNLKMLMNVLDVEYDTHETDIKDFADGFKMYMEG